MTKYSKINIIYHLQKWMDSVAGQTFLNYAYSWGASVVILGTLFKLTHMPIADTMLYIGMGTEVFVFFISAFDRPFDKTTAGMELHTNSQQPKETTEDTSVSNKQTLAELKELNTQLGDMKQNLVEVNGIITRIVNALRIKK